METRVGAAAVKAKFKHYRESLEEKSFEIWCCSGGKMGNAREVQKE
jgi:hypothetical protein